MNSYFAVYLVGYILVIAGVAFGMDAAGIDQTWIIVAVLILAGLGVIYAFGRSQSDEAQKMHAQGRQQQGQGSHSGTQQGHSQSGGGQGGAQSGTAGGTTGGTQSGGAGSGTQSGGHSTGTSSDDPQRGR